MLRNYGLDKEKKKGQAPDYNIWETVFWRFSGLGVQFTSFACFSNIALG